MTISQIVDTEAIYRVAVQQLQATRNQAELVDYWATYHDGETQPLVWPTFGGLLGYSGSWAENVMAKYNQARFARPSATQPGPAAR